MIKKYYKLVEAIQYNGYNWEHLKRFVRNNEIEITFDEIKYAIGIDGELLNEEEREGLIILPGMGEDAFKVGDYLVKENGKFYLYSKGYFEKLYKEAKNEHR